MKKLIPVLFLMAVIACGEKKETNTAKQTEAEDSIKVLQQKYLLSISLADSLCAALISDTTGTFITAIEAKRKLVKYKAFREFHAQHPWAYDTATDAYGFIFGLERIRQLVAKVDAHNKKFPKDSLVGIRAYIGVRELHGKEIPDIFLIPVRKSKEDAERVDYRRRPAGTSEQDRGGMILNSSQPCPTICKR